MLVDAACGDTIAGERCLLAPSELGNLHFHISGKGRPVLFLHGFPEYFAIWRPLLARLQTPVRAIAADLPGFNRSNLADRTRAGTRDIGQMLTAALDELNISRVDIVAHDIGGAAAWQIAAECRARVGGLFLISAPHPADFIRHFWYDCPSARLSYIDELTGADEDAFVLDSERLASLVFSTVTGARLALRDALARSDSQTIRSLYAANIAPIALTRWLSQSPADCAVKVVSSRNDPFVPPILFAGTGVHTKNRCEVVLLDRGGHFLQIVESACVAAHLDAWLAALPGRAGR